MIILSGAYQMQNNMKYWDEGQNCAQSTLRLILDAFGYPAEGELIAAALVPFGGGMKMGSVCGAVSGTIAAMSFIMHRQGLSTDEIVEGTNSMKAEFQKHFNSLLCNDLISPYAPFMDQNAEIAAERRRFCTKLVMSAVASAERVLKNR